MIKWYLLVLFGFFWALSSFGTIDILNHIQLQDKHPMINGSSHIPSNLRMDYRITLLCVNIDQWYTQLNLTDQIKCFALKGALIRNVLRPYRSFPWIFYEEGPSLLEALNS